MNSSLRHAMALIDLGRERLRRKRADSLIGSILPHIEVGQRVLDFGCGDLSLAEALVRRLGRRAHLVGVEVAASRSWTTRRRAVPLVLYDGQRLPFADGSFDTSFAAFVLHHSRSGAQLLRELLRVTRGQVIVLEDVFQHRLELLLLRCFDAANLVVDRHMSLPFAFKTESEWIEAGRTAGATYISAQPIRPAMPKPTRHRAFVMRGTETTRGWAATGA